MFKTKKWKWFDNLNVQDSKSESDVTTSLFKRWIPDLFLIDIRPKLEAQRLGRRLEKYFILKGKFPKSWTEVSGDS